LWLVVNKDFGVVDGTAQVPLQLQALVDAHVHLLSVELEIVAPQLFCAIHGHIGIFEQRLGIKTASLSWSSSSNTRICLGRMASRVAVEESVVV